MGAIHETKTACSHGVDSPPNPASLFEQLGCGEAGRSQRRTFRASLGSSCFTSSRFGSVVIGEPVAFVTGASEGIGRAVATHLVRLGYRTVAAARSSRRLDELATEAGVIPVTVDVVDEQTVTRTVNRVESEIGPIDLLVNNAGIAGHSGVSWEQEPLEWWEVVEVSLRGTFLCSHAVLLEMIRRKRGRIVNLSSGAAANPIPDDYNARINSAYMASKAAVNRFTEALAAEAGSFGVTVFAISPGRVKTKMWREAVVEDWDEPNAWSAPELAAELVACIASGALDDHSGQFIHAAYDDWRTMAGL
jgi:3-oxoacyl-[acyl-carrier protein] reductase